MGRYETQARAAKLVPFIERLAGVVAPRSMTEGALRRLGASTKKQRVYMTSRKNKQLIAKLKTKAMKISFKIKYQNTGLLKVIESVKVTSTDFIRSPEWRELRKKAIAKYGSTCVMCGKVGSKKYPINIDHIKPRKYYPELAMDINNLQPLCGGCNKRKGNKVALVLSKGNTNMNRQEANQLLNQVREGVLHPPAAIIKALTITGDIHDKCSSPYNSTDSRGTDSHSPSVSDFVLQVLEGEQE